jgi:Family of unknown function (DUF5317)
MIILVALLVSMIVALLRGGQLTNLASLNLRWRGVIIAGFLLQVLIFSSSWESQSALVTLTPLAYLISMLLLLAALAANYRLPGMRLLAIGFFLNFAAIVLNGGHMPASPAALQAAGLHVLQPGQISSNSIGMGANTIAFFICDIFAIPEGFIFPNVFSVGDVLIAAGAVYLAQKALVDSTSQHRPSESAPLN